MKVGILTFHRAENFGAVLQAYALQTFLCRQGYDVKIIDYRCPVSERAYQIYNPSILWSRKNFFISFKKYLSRIHHARIRKIKKKKYIKFRDDYLSLSAKVDTYPKEACDLFVVGSDQVWNFSLTDNDKIFLLDFPMSPHAKRISYAASSEGAVCKRIREGCYKDMLDKVNEFDAVSVREAELKESLQNIIKKDIQVHLDPSFLLSKADYEKILILPKEKHYVLVYHLYETEQGSILADGISKKKGLEVIEIHAIITGDKRDNQKFDLGPREILGYIANADTVITTSFHGLAFSLIMEKDVWVMNVGNNSRQKNLLDACDISGRLISKFSDYNETCNINYEKVNDFIKKGINESANFFDIVDSI